MAAPTTSVPNGTKLGRPPALDREVLRSLFPELSERSFARLVRSFRIITDLFGADFWQKAVELASRPNGSLNIAHLERAANRLLMQHVAGELDQQMCAGTHPPARARDTRPVTPSAGLASRSGVPTSSQHDRSTT